MGPSKVESYLEVNAWTGWQKQAMILEYGQGLTCWTHKYYTGHLKLANFWFQSLTGLVNLLQLYPVTIINFKTLIREHESYNDLWFGSLFVNH